MDLTQMNSLKNLKMEKEENFLKSKNEIEKVRSRLEKKTEVAFRNFVQSKNQFWQWWEVWE